MNVIVPDIENIEFTGLDQTTRAYCRILPTLDHHV